MPETTHSTGPTITTLFHPSPARAIRPEPTARPAAIRSAETDMPLASMRYADQDDERVASSHEICRWPRSILPAPKMKTPAVPSTQNDDQRNGRQRQRKADRQARLTA